MIYLDRSGLLSVPWWLKLGGPFGAWLVSCVGAGGVYAFLVSEQGANRQHCAFGCALGKCMGAVPTGDVAERINDVYEWWTGRRGDWEEDNRAARVGAEYCKRDCGSCNDCCGDLFP